MNRDGMIDRLEGRAGRDQEDGFSDAGTRREISRIAREM